MVATDATQLICPHCGQIGQQVKRGFQVNTGKQMRWCKVCNFRYSEGIYRPRTILRLLRPKWWTAERNDTKWYNLLLDDDFWTDNYFWFQISEPRSSLHATVF
eukprot:g35892.t1